MFVVVGQVAVQILRHGDDVERNEEGNFFRVYNQYESLAVPALASFELEFLRDSSILLQSMIVETNTESHSGSTDQAPETKNRRSIQRLPCSYSSIHSFWASMSKPQALLTGVALGVCLGFQWGRKRR